MDDWFDGVPDPDDRDLMAEDVPEPWSDEEQDYPRYDDEPMGSGHFGHDHE